jgi:hypothetical protein
MIGLGLGLCQERLFTPFPAAPALWTRKPSAMLAVYSAPASRWRPFARRMTRCPG